MRVGVVAGAVGSVCVLVVALCLAGCGGSNDSSQAADVALVAQVTADQPGQITSLTIAAQHTGDTISAANPTAKVRRPDGTSAPVALDLDAAGKTLTVGPATLVPSASAAAERAAQGEPPGHADVPVLATVVADTPGEITSATVEALEPGDTLNIDGATARIRRTDGTSAPVSLTINDAHTVVTLGRATVARGAYSGPYWSLDTLEIQGPISVTDGPTGHKTIIGSLAFSFGVEPDGTVLGPNQIHASIPTAGTADDRRVVIDGLEPERGYAWTVITDKDGGLFYSRPYVADRSGEAIIPDSLARITAELLSGGKSRIELCFAGWPRYAPPPLGPPTDGGIGPGGGGVPTGLDSLVIKGPFRLQDGHTNTSVELGGFAFGFEVLADGTVVAPATVSFSIPTRRSGTNRNVVVSGLEAGDFIETAVETEQGQMYESWIHRADASGGFTITDAFAHVTAQRLSGRHSSFALFFARTDSNGDGLPDYF